MGGSVESAAAEIRILGQRALCVQVDTVDEESVATMFDVADRFGKVTSVVNNAGAATAVGRPEQNDLAVNRRDMDVNLFGVIIC